MIVITPEESSWRKQVRLLWEGKRFVYIGCGKPVPLFEHIRRARLIHHWSRYPYAKNGEFDWRASPKTWSQCWWYALSVNWECCS